MRYGGGVSASLEHAEQPWANGLGHLLWEVSARTAQLADAALADTGLTVAAVGLLDQIATQPGITMAEIARQTPKSPQAISQMVARMERLGFVERRLAGGRSIGLHITDAGGRARAAGNAAEDGFEQELRSTLGAERYEQLRATLRDARALLAEMRGRHPA